MKLQTFISEVIKQIEAGAKEAQAAPPEVIHMEIKLNSFGEICRYCDEPKAEVKMDVYPKSAVNSPAPPAVSA